MRQLEENRLFNCWWLFAFVFVYGMAIVFFHGIVCLLAAVGLMIILGYMYYGFRCMGCGTFSSVVIVMPLMMLISFLKPSIQWISIALIGLSLMPAMIYRLSHGLKGTKPAHHGIVALPAEDWIAWLIVFILVLFLGLMNSHGFFYVDKLHPIYELSCGNSFGQSLIHAPDLSYLDKEIRFHFLTTRIPILFSNLFKIPTLESVFFLAPLFNLVLAFVMISSFFSKYPQIRVPIWLVFFMPLVWQSPFGFENIFQRTVLLTNSYFSAFLLMIAVAYYLTSGRSMALVLVMSVLLIVRASFFITACGGIFIYLMMNRQIKLMFKILVPLILIFAALYKVFLSGAHLHNLWIFFPSFVYEAFVPLIAGLSVFKIAGQIFYFMYFTMIYLMIFIGFVKYKCDKHLAVYTSMAVSGALLSLGLTEATEENSFQFLTASYFCIVVIMWRWGKDIFNKSSRTYRNFGISIFSLFVIISIMTPIKPIASNWARWYINSNFVNVNDWKNDLSLFTSKVISIMGEPIPDLPQGLTEAYDDLKREEKGIVLFGKHYEYKGAAISNEWWPDTGFARSALSNQQMYCENYKYKGIGMEPDYPERFAACIFFYRNFVESSPESKRVLDAFYRDNYGKEKGTPLSQMHGGYRSVVRILSMGKQWCWLNQPKQIKYEVKQKLRELEALNYKGQKEWLKDFVAKAKIQYIVLENNDKPSKILLSIGRPIYSNDFATVLEIKKNADI